MAVTLKNARIIDGDRLVYRDLIIDDGVIVKIGEGLLPIGDVYELGGKLVMPGAIDVHAHLREPGFEYKETVKTGTMSAAKGGITAIMSMPNLNPVPDSAEHVKVQLDIIERDAVIDVYPFGSVTVGELGKEPSDYQGLAPYVKGFSDDGKGVNDLALLGKAMDFAGEHGFVIASHAEKAGYGTTPEAEILAVRDEIELLRGKRCAYHFCHISTEESWAMIKQAKAEGLDVTAEATPHHIYYDLSAAKDGNYKMNPPLRKASDVRATIEAIIDGTADMIATDHAPHAKEEKGDYRTALNGIIGFETMFPVTYTVLVRSGKINWRRFEELTVVNPARRFGLPYNRIAEGERADIAVLDIDNERIYSEAEVLSKSVNSPFIGEKLYGFNVMTLKNGKIIYKDNL